MADPQTDDWQSVSGVPPVQPAQPQAPADGDWAPVATKPSSLAGPMPPAYIDLPDEPHGLSVAQAIAFEPVRIYRGIRDLFLQPGTTYKQGATPEQEIDFATNWAMMEVSGKILGGKAQNQFTASKVMNDAVAEPSVEFKNTVTTPIADEQTNAMVAKSSDPLQALHDHIMQLDEAKQAGILDGSKPTSLNELPPEEAGQKVMAAANPGASVVSEPSPWRQRWEETLDKMATPDDVRKVISGIVDANDEFILARQGDMRPVQIEQLADVSGMKPGDIDVAGTSSKIKSDVELRNVTEAFRTVTEKIRQAASEGDPEKFTEAELQRDLLLQSTTATKGLVGLRAEFGRAGNRLKEFYAAQREATGMKSLYDEMGRTESDIKDRMKVIADAPPGATPGILESTRNPKPGWLFWTWQQGLISGPVTHARYAEVNAATVGLERVVVPEIAAIIDRARGGNSTLTGPLWANLSMIKSVPDAWEGTIQAFRTGLRVPLESELKLAARNEANPEAAGAKTPYIQHAEPEWGVWKKVFNEDQLSAAARVLGIPGRAANAFHTFFKILSERAAGSLKAYEATAAEGVKGDKFDTRYQYHLANPTDEALSATVDEAYSGAFMEKLGDKSGALARALRNNPVTKWLFPFQHIPWNIERMTARYAGVGLFDIPGYTQMGKALHGELGAPAQNVALGRIAAGTAIAGYFVSKGLSGNATGDYPLDQKERRRWSLLNTQPNSVKFGDSWYSLNRLGPPGNLARIGANLGEIIKNYDGKDDNALLKAVGAFSLAIVNQFADETGFETTRNLIDILEGKQSAARFLAWQAGSFTPFSSFTSQAASFMDPDMRVADGFVQGLMYRTPLLREGLLPKRDAIYGEPIHNPGYHTIFRENPTMLDKAKLEMARVGYYPMPPQKTIGHVKLTNEQYDQYEATAGPLVKNYLQNYVNNPGYENVPDAMKKNEMEGLIKLGRAQGRQAFLAQHQDIVKQSLDARRTAIFGQP